MPQGHSRRRSSRNRRLLLMQCLKLSACKNHKYAIVSWNLRLLGLEGWGKTSWLKLKMATSRVERLELTVFLRCKEFLCYKRVAALEFQVLLREAGLETLEFTVLLCRARYEVLYFQVILCLLCALRDAGFCSILCYCALKSAGGSSVFVR